MSNEDRIITRIKELITLRPKDEAGIVADGYETQDVGIRCYHYDVIGPEGLYSGYWTDKDDIPENENQIALEILSSEDCTTYFEELPLDELESILGMLES
jgi:hypothetical protein